MGIFKQIIEVRWSDIDANHHVTHTAYATFATHARVEWMTSVGCSMARMFELNFGAFILKEETEYFREILLGEKVVVDIAYTGVSNDYAFWKFTHKIYKSNNKLAAKHTVYGAWINNKTRKITPPPKEILDMFVLLQRDADFEIITKSARS
jgi:acyl-CoA thioester hydrolase